MFKVKFPESLKENQVRQLNEALAFTVKKPQNEDMDVAETCLM